MGSDRFFFLISRAPPCFLVHDGNIFDDFAVEPWDYKTNTRIHRDVTVFLSNLQIHP